jgi:transposase
MAGSVNFVWNFCNETSLKAIRNYSDFLSGFDLNKLTSGCGKELGLHSQTIQAICEEYSTKRKKAKKRKLHWRSSKRSLGWVPFKASAIKMDGSTLVYNKLKLRIWKTREFDISSVLMGSFTQDARGRWYANLVVEVEQNKQLGELELGVDLGLKTQATLSDGRKYQRQNITKKYEAKLAMAQRANKKRQVQAIHARIANIRKDWNHKTANAMLAKCKIMYIGDVSSIKLAKTKMAKSVLDAGWGQLRSFLEYKANLLGTIRQDTNESFSTVTCSHCLKKTGPQGLRQLGVREWTCSNCETVHDRDENSAKNILRMGHHTPL